MGTETSCGPWCGASDPCAPYLLQGTEQGQAGPWQRELIAYMADTAVIIADPAFGVKVESRAGVFTVYCRKFARKCLTLSVSFFQNTSEW